MENKNEQLLKAREKFQEIIKRSRESKANSQSVLREQLFNKEQLAKVREHLDKIIQEKKENEQK